MDITQFKSAMRNGGARTNLFQVQITNPVDPSTDLILPFRCRGASLPASNINMIELPYNGRKIKVAGVKTYEDWNITVQEDEDYALRNAFEAWSNMINLPEANVRDAGSSDMSIYKADAIVQSLSQTGRVS